MQIELREFAGAQEMLRRMLALHCKFKVDFKIFPICNPLATRLRWWMKDEDILDAYLDERNDRMQKWIDDEEHKKLIHPAILMPGQKN